MIRSFWRKQERVSSPYEAQSPQSIDSFVPRECIDIGVRNVFEACPDHITIGDPQVDDLVQSIAYASISPVTRPIPGDAMPVAGDIERTIAIDTPVDLPDGADVSMYAMPLPVDAFVAAPEITSWQKGRGMDMKGDRTSAQVVSSYAVMRADTAPPIQHVTVYVRADGACFAQLQGDGAHRLCAAKRRGDSHIYARNVRIALLRPAS